MICMRPTAGKEPFIPMFPELLSLAGRPTLAALAVLAVLSVGACQPTVKVQAPDKPIEINLNVRIDQEVRVKLDRDLEDLFSEKDEIF